MEIERHLDIQGRADKLVKKLLLLGSGSSGKSTLFKQLKCIYDIGFEQHDLITCRHTLRQNVVTGMIKLLQKSQKLYDEDNEKYSHLLVDMNNEKTYAAVQICVKFRNENFAEELPPNDEMKALGIYFIQIAKMRTYIQPVLR